MAIKRFNVNDEEYFGDNIYLIHRPYILSNPYTHIKDKKTKAMFVVSSIEEAIEKYEHYFDIMYGKNLKFTKVIDEIYDKFKNGEEIMLGCYCDKNKQCHGDVIIKKIKNRFVKEKIEEIKSKKNL